MKLPTRDECIAYFEEYKVPSNIKKHCVRVEEVSTFLAQNIQKSGVEISVDLVSRTGLLHDIFKMVTITDFGNGPHKDAGITPEQIEFWKNMQEKFPNKYEGDVAFEIFKESFPQLAKSIKNAGNPQLEEYTLEEGIVHYADWRVFQNTIVQLQVRLDYLQQRYPREKNIWDVYVTKIKELEATIFMNLEFTPQQLQEKLEIKRNKK
jgi:hypothetical protein